MKNEKGLSATLNTFLIVMLVLLAISIFWVVIQGLLTPEKHFQIYKEECSNQTIYPFCKLTLFVSLGCPHCETQKSILEENNIEGITIIDCFKETEKCFSEDIIKVPSWKVGGDEEIYSGMKTIAQLGEILNESWEGEVCELIEVEKIIMSNMNCVDKDNCGILKEYLTIEVLEENCLCNEWCNKDVCVEKSVFDMEIKDMECVEYSCEDHTVKVWSQIK